MYQQDHRTTTLPRSLRKEISVTGKILLHFRTQVSDGLEEISSNRKNRTVPGLRKERRKAARTEKKLKRPHNGTGLLKEYERASTTKHPSKHPTAPLQNTIEITYKQDRVKAVPLRSETKPQVSKHTSRSRETKKISSPSSSPEPSHVTKEVRDKLAADDAEIAALEKALGVKGKKKLPKSFEEDGLDVLLDGLEDEASDDTVRGKRKRDDGETWLETKRKKARNADRGVNPIVVVSTNDGEESGSSFGGLSDGENEPDNYFLSSDEERDGESSSQDSDEVTSLTSSARKQARENPYRAPVTSAVPAPKYVPPSLRTQAFSETEDLSRLRRQIQGLINRLSEANVISILGDVESLYRGNPRQHVSSALLDLLIGLLSDTASLQDTFVVLHAGFFAAVYKTVGSDFGAQAVQRIDEVFRVNYGVNADDGQRSKKLTNLMSLISQLYTFQVVGSNIVYEYIKLFIKDLSENNAELLLKIVRSAGAQLRQDDPLALKEIVLLVQDAVTRIGEKNLSVRTRFMIETINDLKNNRMKTGIAASSVVSEHVIRMKKLLGSLNTRSIKASEPLRIGLKDIRESDKRGKWWLVGASYKDPNEDAAQMTTSLETNNSPWASDQADFSQDMAGDVLQIAREQRMNTDVRRSIFVAIMSATDYNDAFQRLMKLRLKKSQELEIPKVIIHCAGAEEAYNPYYTLLSRRVCTDRKLKMAFQFSLWAFIKRLGEGVDEDEEAQDEAEDDDEKLGMKTIVNLAKMFGTLVAEGGMKLNALKILNLAYLQPKTRIFVELLIITIILHSQKGVSGARDEEKLVGIFMQARSNPEMVKGLLYFLKKTVSKTDVADTQADRETVKWGCRVARDILRPMAQTELEV
ncbi:MAG: hypothetical protein Q9201_007971 [Fulgogasparrea decipioides]